jgi:hypothetical protein
MDSTIIIAGFPWISPVVFAVYFPETRSLEEHSLPILINNSPTLITHLGG